MKHHGEQVFIALYDGDNDTLLGHFSTFKELALNFEISEKSISMKLYKDEKKHIYNAHEYIQKIDGTSKIYWFYLFDDNENDNLDDLNWTGEGEDEQQTS